MKKRIKKERRIMIILLSLVVLLVFILFLTITANKEKKVEAKEIECVKDNDCLIIRAACCPCEMGGEPICIPKTRLNEFTKMLEKCSRQESCSENKCSKITCGCVNNKCVGQRI
ncbi:MAG: hypothetical protein N3D20_03275 [Candidatus Pacearchaeota archaeon]|nr:hypothetical protein [Candidatus Pacearchaeota archaeon]